MGHREETLEQSEDTLERWLAGVPLDKLKEVTSPMWNKGSMSFSVYAGALTKRGDGWMDWLQFHFHCYLKETPFIFYL